MKQIQNWTQKYTGTWESRPLGWIKYIGICHTAFPASQNQDSGRIQSLEEVCNDIDFWHRNRGWTCISYHYVIAKNGDIAQCNTLESNSYTVGNNRTVTVCICLDGNFEFQQPTIEQLQSLQDLCHELAANHPEFPAGMADIYGDNELNYAGVGASDGSNPTACPGKNLMPFVIELRTTGQISILKTESKTMGNTNTTLDQVRPNILEALKNPYYKGMLDNNDTTLAVNDLVERDQEIELLKKTLDNLNTNLNQPKKVVDFNPANASPKVEFDNLPKQEVKTSNIESLRDKIKTGHILEVLLSTLFGLITFLNTSGFNPNNFTDRHSMIAGALTLVASYFGFRSDLIKNEIQK